MDAALVNAARNAYEVLFKLKGIDISLIPEQGERVEKPSGGFKFEPAAPLPSQRFSLRSVSGDSDGIVDSEGVRHQSFDYILTARYDSVVPIPSFFVIGENRYRVEHEFPRAPFVRKFGVNSKGPEPISG